MNLTISSIKSEIIEGHYQSETFLIESLESGQAITLANAIRRTMLTELYGFAITGVKINDLKHEFESIDFVREDVLEILLNLKQIVFQPSFFLFYSDIQKIPVFLHVKGPCVVTASMFRLPVGMLNIVNPEQYICTLTNNSEFYCEVEVEYGKGFCLKEEHGEQADRFLENQIQEVTTSNLEEELLDEIGEIPEITEPKNRDYKEKLLLEKKKKFSIKKGLGAILKEKILNIYDLLSTAKERIEKKITKKLKKKKKITKKKLFEKLVEKKVEKKLEKISDNLETVIDDFIPSLGSPFLFVLDTNFSPIKNINFKVRLITDSLGNLKESLLLEITTNGSFTPKRCLQESVKLLINLFSSFLIIDYLDELMVNILPEFENQDTRDFPMHLNYLKKSTVPRPEYWPDDTQAFPYFQQFLQEKKVTKQNEVESQKKIINLYQSFVQNYDEDEKKNTKTKYQQKSLLFIHQLRKRIKKKLLPSESSSKNPTRN